MSDDIDYDSDVPPVVLDELDERHLRPEACDRYGFKFVNVEAMGRRIRAAVTQKWLDKRRKRRRIKQEAGI
jgi:hypothetical protein